MKTHSADNQIGVGDVEAANMAITASKYRISTSSQVEHTNTESHI